MRIHKTYAAKPDTFVKPPKVRVLGHLSQVAKVTTGSVAVCVPLEPPRRRCLWRLVGVLPRMLSEGEKDLLLPLKGRAFVYLEHPAVEIVDAKGVTIWRNHESFG